MRLDREQCTGGIGTKGKMQTQLASQCRGARMHMYGKRQCAAARSKFIS